MCEGEQINSACISNIGFSTAEKHILQFKRVQAQGLSPLMHHPDTDQLSPNPLQILQILGGSFPWELKPRAPICVFFLPLTHKQG